MICCEKDRILVPVATKLAGYHSRTVTYLWTMALTLPVGIGDEVVADEVEVALGIPGGAIEEVVIKKVLELVMISCNIRAAFSD